ncbi:MAG: protein kinase [Planctomycetales bacterium]|nr:protein kinase [Planctomycetales bacterium]
MDSERTQQQSTEQKIKSKDLSRQRSQPPADIPGYQTRRFLGSGAYGEVWVALDQNTGRQVAIKFYTHRSGLDLGLLKGEVEKLVFLSADRYVVQLLDVGWDADPPYYVMEFIENGSLEDHLRRNGPMPVGEAVELFREVVTGLLHSHNKGVLHCDLKPANVLLDQDNKPRLADFGQSRLSHEQSPALGTLFYMAPEQASLEAVPDARWDVYALGALFYCMLTGEAPHRSDNAVSEIDSQPHLEDRLVRYREFLARSAAPSRHAKLRGMDRSLAQIIDRCLVIDPEQRYANVQSVLDALMRRDAERDRRPLLILGLLGPLLFLLVALTFGWRGYSRAVEDSNRMLFLSAKESNGFAADFVAEAVARRIEGYFRLTEEFANMPEVRAEVSKLKSEIAELQTKLVDPNLSDSERHSLRQLMTHHPARQALATLVENRLKESVRPEIASWFVTNERGVHLAAVFDTPADESPVGGHFAYRSYFSGLPDDLPAGTQVAADQHITDTYLSAEFKSSATNAWKVAVSSPIYIDGEFSGIAALTVELGRLGELLGQEQSKRRFNVLVEGRTSDRRGVILQHPLFSEILGASLTRRSTHSDAAFDAQAKLPDEFSEDVRYRVDLDHWDPDQPYQDPLGQHPQGGDFQHAWIAAKRVVALDRRTADDEIEQIETGLVVLVQEELRSAIAPVKQLGDWLFKLGLFALGVLTSVILLLWFFVARAVRDPDERVRKLGGAVTNTTSLHNMETVELPNVNANAKNP